MGSANSGNIAAAYNELKTLQGLKENLIAQKDSYKANQVDVQLKTSEAWISFREGKTEEALRMMYAAADQEDKTEKHPVTPGEVIPARELLGDMLLEMNKPADALLAYEANLKTHANRFNGLYGAAMAAKKSGNRAKTNNYFKKLTSFSKIGNGAVERF